MFSTTSNFTVSTVLQYNNKNAIRANQWKINCCSNLLFYFSKLKTKNPQATKLHELAGNLEIYQRPWIFFRYASWLDREFFAVVVASTRSLKQTFSIEIPTCPSSKAMVSRSSVATSMNISNIARRPSLSHKLDSLATVVRYVVLSSL